MKSFIFATLFLTSILLSQTRGTHYQDPNLGCLPDEQILVLEDNNKDTYNLGDNNKAIYKATCSANCNYNACPTDVPSDGIYINTICLPRNADGNRMCAIECPGISYCPDPGRCIKMTFPVDQTETNRNRVLQSTKIDVC